VKKFGNFDVAMGSLDGAEVCELVSLFLLDQLTGIMDKKNIGLYTKMMAWKLLKAVGGVSSATHSLSRDRGVEELHGNPIVGPHSKV